MRLVARYPWPVARLAERRLPAGRYAGILPARVPWLPVALRWRRKRKRADRVRDAHSATPPAPSIAWYAQFHLHFSVLANERSRRERELRSFAPAAVIRELERNVTNRHWTTVCAATLALVPRAVQHTQRIFATRRTVRVSETVARQQLRELTTHARTTQVERRVLVESVRRSATSSFRERLTERRMQSHETRVFRALTVAAHRTERLTERRMQSHETRVFRALTVATHRIREESTSSHVQLLRPAMLVWRTAPQSQTETSDSAMRASPPMAFSRPPVRSAAAQELAPEAPRRTPQRALQTSDLDPAFIDRLTDDVIRRVDKRVRIERERRGL